MRTAGPRAIERTARCAGGRGAKRGLGVWAACRGEKRPHPALRATFSRRREKGWECGACRSAGRAALTTGRAAPGPRPRCRGPACCVGDAARPATSVPEPLSGAIGWMSMSQSPGTVHPHASALPFPRACGGKACSIGPKEGPRTASGGGPAARLVGGFLPRPARMGENGGSDAVPSPPRPPPAFRRSGRERPAARGASPLPTGER